MNVCGESHSERLIRLKGEGRDEDFQQVCMKLQNAGMSEGDAYRRAALDFLPAVGRLPEPELIHIKEQAPTNPPYNPDMLSDLPLMSMDAAGRKPPSLFRDVIWVAEHIGVTGLSPDHAPSALAWGLYLWATTSQANATHFWTRVMPQKSGIEQAARFEDTGEQVEELIARFEGHKDYAAK